MAGNNSELLQPLRFTGVIPPYSTSSSGDFDLSPNDFIREVQARKAKYAWTDAQTLNQMQGAFKGAAADWYYTSLKKYMTATDYTALTSDLKEFIKAFSARFNLETEDELPSLHRIAFQSPNESLDNYFARQDKLVDDLFTASRTRVNEFTPPTFPQAERDYIAAAPNGLSDQILGHVADTQKAAADHVILEIMNSMVQAFIVHGLQNKALQQTGYALLKEKLALRVFCSRLKAAAKKMQAESRKPPFKKGVSEIEAKEEQPENVVDAEVHAVGKAKKKTKKARGNKKAQNGSDKRAEICLFCKRFGHVEQNCFAKKRIQEAAAAQGQTPATADPNSLSALNLNGNM